MRKMCKKTVCNKIVAVIVIMVALLMGIGVTVLPQNSLAHLVAATRFFDVMIPALAVGALLKYLLCGGNCCQKNQDSCEKKD